jgi:hypothetical protein
MKINTLRELMDWAESQSGGIPWNADPLLAERAVEDIAGVIHRHAFGQGLAWGDDWSIVLELYPVEALRRIADESARVHGRGKRRSR